jgi:hypothetical protein
MSDPYLRCDTCGQRVTAEMDDKRHCELIDAIERSRSTMRAQLESVTRERDAAISKLEWYQVRDIHTCHAKCKKPLCVMGRERDALKAALEEYTTCRHVGLACAAECSQHALVALERMGARKGEG